MMSHVNRLLIRVPAARARTLGDVSAQQKCEFHGQQQTSNNDNKQQTGNKEKEPRQSCFTCPFVLAIRQLSHCAGLIGVSWIVSNKLIFPYLWCQQKKDQHDILRPHLAGLKGPTSPGINLFVRDYRWAHPVYSARASPILGPKATGFLLSEEENVKTVARSSTDSEKELPQRNSKPLSEIVSDYKKEFKKVASAYVESLRNNFGIALLDAGHGDEGMKMLYANEASARTLYNLGVAYETGKYATGETTPNLNLAFEYYERAAGMGHKFATYNLALFYLYGKGPAEKDVSEGLRLLKQAYELGVEQASVYSQIAGADVSRRGRQLDSASPPLRGSSSAPNLQVLISNLLSFQRKDTSTDSSSSHIDNAAMATQLVVSS